MDELAEKLLIDPFVTDISPAAKSEVASLDVKVNDKLASEDVSPSDTSAAVMVIVGPTLSNVQLNWDAAVLLLPDPSVKALPATSIVVAPAVLGVKVAV